MTEHPSDPLSLRSIRFLLSLPDRLLSRACSLLWARALSVPSPRLHWTSRIVGVPCIRIGARFQAGRYLWIEAVQSFNEQHFEPSIVFGDDINVSDLVHIAAISSVVIGNGVLIGSKVIVTDHNHGVYSGAGEHSSPQERPNRRALAGAPVRIGDRAFLGDNVVVLPGSTIGEGAIVGANSTVSGEIPPATIAVGNPARPVRRYDPVACRWLPLT